MKNAPRIIINRYVEMLPVSAHRGVRDWGPGGVVKNAAGRGNQDKEKYQP